jgi:HK97 family phage prohead protease
MTGNERTLITADTFRKMARKGARADDFAEYSVLKYGAIIAKDATPADEADRLIEFVLSNANLDREGDSIAVAGWNLDAYVNNPVVLWAHDHGELPVAKATTTWIDGQQLKARDAFADAALYPFADVVYRMLRGGFLNACSVGFQPHEWEMTDSGVNFLQQDLLEHSVCPVPAHPEALVVARSKGIDVRPLKAWAERTLDLLSRRAKGDGDGQVRLQLERLRVQSDPTGRKLFTALSDVDLRIEDEPTVPIKRPAQANAAAALERAAAMLRSREKAGARHSAADQALLQGAHDALVSLGATCTPVAAEDDKHIAIDGARVTNDEAIDELLETIAADEMHAIIEAALAPVLREQLMLVTGRVD